jgi:small-conductance mechanosensitive channel
MMPQTVQSLNSLLTARTDLFLTWLLTSGVRLVLLLVAAYILLRLIRLLTNKFSTMLQGFARSVERQKRAQTLSHIVQAVATTTLCVVTIMLVLGELGVNIAPLLAAAGIGGLAIGFGAQNLVRDVITGFFILLEDQIRVGDVVKVGDKSGLVENIGLRVLTLRDFDGSVHMIPNGTITTVTNMTKDFSYAVISVGASYGENLDEVMAVLAEVGANLRRDPAFAPDILEDLEVVGVDDFADAQVKLTLRIKTIPTKQWRVGRELRRRIKQAFDARGIRIREGVQPPRVTLDSHQERGRADQARESERGTL